MNSHLKIKNYETCYIIDKFELEQYIWLEVQFFFSSLGKR